MNQCLGVHLKKTRTPEVGLLFLGSFPQKPCLSHKKLVYLGGDVKRDLVGLVGVLLNSLSGCSWTLVIFLG